MGALPRLSYRAFAVSERDDARRLVASITASHVMAGSKYNLRNARLAVLHLAQGDLNDLRYYVRCAQSDFRDVVWWASGASG